MESKRVFAHTPPELLPVLEELIRREPIFHAPDFGSSIEEYEKRMSPDYWEVGASGRRYSREFILQNLRGKTFVFAKSVGWTSWDHALRRLGVETYLMTYVLQQGVRLTRRATIWQRVPDGWQILYHQGTVILVEEDNVSPP